MLVELRQLLEDRGVNASITPELIDGIVSRRFDSDLPETADTIAKNYKNVVLYSVEVVTCQRIISTQPMLLETGDSLVVRMKGF